ncbi:hypothetical protein [Bradyrhizobium sp. 131]|uniref:hypothetical protein n=1 Tax=Bradyrhizobium sp. 131 TaxID=2782609 RepID=UPI001FFEF9FB|nr:hypothetical protein [Bradyrhizobium sp. 131]
MTSQAEPSLGVLLLKRGVQPLRPNPTPLAGSLTNPATFNFPVISERVEGAWVENVVRSDPSLGEPYIVAARRLVDRDAVTISSNCGFSNSASGGCSSLAESFRADVSSPLLLPALLRQLPTPAKIAVLTYDSSHCGEDLLGVDDLDTRARIVIGVIEGGKFWHDELKRRAPPVDIAAIDSIRKKEEDQCVKP